MTFGIGNNGGTYGGDEEDDESPNGPDTPVTRQLKQMQEMEGTPSTMKKGGHVKKTGLIKMHKGETVIPAIRSMRIQIHRGPKKEVPGFTVHHEGMPEATKSAAFLKDTHQSHPFSADQHEQMLDHIDQHLAGQS